MHVIDSHTFNLAARLFVSCEAHADIGNLRKSFSLVNAGTVSLPINMPGTTLNKSIKAAKLIRKDLHKMIQKRKADIAEGKASPSQDLLSYMLLTCHEDGSHMKESEIADSILGALLAGFDSLSAALTFIVKYLAELPHIYDAVYKEQMDIVNAKSKGESLKWEDLQKMKYSWNVAQEVTRMTPTAQGTFREAITDFTYNGFTIPKGWKLYWSTYSTHKNADYFPEPENHTFKLAARFFVSLEDQADIDKLRKPFGLVNAGILSLPINFPGTSINKAIKAAQLIRKDMLKMIKERKNYLAEGKASPPPELLSHFLFTCQEDGSYMDESRIVDTMIGTLVGGFDSVSAALTFIVKYLAELPHIHDAVYKEQVEIVNSKPAGEPLKLNDLHKMKYSWNVAQEVMRMTPPFPGNFREAITDFVYNGFTIPKGWKLFWSATWTHKNADYFPESDKFDPSRFAGNGPAPYTFVPFGGGPRMCPGNEYVRVVILVFMHHFVTRFKLEKVIPYEKTIVAGIPMPAEGLPIRLYNHHKM